MNSNGQKPAAEAASPGARIRGLRLGQRLTLAQMSDRTGLAISTLSKLEKGDISLSYDKLMLISKGLNVDVASLVDPKPQVAREPLLGAGRRVVHRAGEGQLVETHSYRQHYMATELLNKKITPIMVEIRARTLEEFTAEFGDLIRHPGEEFTLVLDGELDFHSELYAPLRLRAGDSIYFDSEMGHAYIKASDALCRIVCSCAPRGDEDAMTEMFVNASGRLGGGTAAEAAGVEAGAKATPSRPRPTVKRARRTTR
jgi:transcriptional regulator with XRE-family HTH domain